VAREFDGQSDRAVAVVGVSLLDIRLTRLLEQVMLGEGPGGKLFAPNQPLGTYSGKTQVAYSFGLISRQEYRNLVLMGRVRNVFAHQLGDLSFQSEQIRARCAELQLPLSYRAPGFVPLSTEDGRYPVEQVPPRPVDTPRQQFEVATKGLSIALLVRAALTDSAVSSPAEFSGPAEMNRLVQDWQRSQSSDQHERLERLESAIVELLAELDETGESDEKQRLLGDLERQTAEISSIRDDKARFIDPVAEFHDQVVEFMREWEAYYSDEGLNGG
jgi:hypothetical protein